MEILPTLCLIAGLYAGLLAIDTERTRAAQRLAEALDGTGELAGPACYDALGHAGVAFEPVAPQDARGVKLPMRLRGPLSGIDIRGGRPHGPAGILDCRLAHALLAWTPTLRKSGITQVDHYSMYRAGAHIAGTGKVSAHAHGLAIDAARFHVERGGVVNVLEHWGSHAAGASPCSLRPWEDQRAKLLRRIFCSAATQNIFQIIITPHYNAAHRNHVHLELKADKDEPWVR